MTDDSELSEIAARNRSLWDERSAEYQQTHGGQLAASGGAAWGLWQIPEAELSALDDVAGHDVLEFGCGAAQWSIALHGQGARVTALDNSARQLEHARSLMAAAGAEFRLVHASAEATGLMDASFDIVFCDHGAMTFADPHRTIPEAARLLRIGGLLAFSMHTPILDMAWEPEHDYPSDRLSRNYWELHALQEPGEPVAYQLRYGTWIRLFRKPRVRRRGPARAATTRRRQEQLPGRHRPRLGAALADGAHLEGPPSGRPQAPIADTRSGHRLRGRRRWLHLPA